MSELLSFHNDQTVKDKYLSRIIAHAKADEIIKGKYWEGGKGCAVGCTIHSGNHKAYETELGLPEWLARLEDSIFEGLSNEDAKTFPQRFLEIIPVGKNLEPVKWKFCVFILKENIERVLLLDISDELKEQVVDAIQQCLKVQEIAIETNQWPGTAAESARSAAWAAAWAAAWPAAWSAAGPAGSAARSARTAAWPAAWSTAESTAESAAWSARSAAESAAESAAYQRYANELLRLLKIEGDK